ARYREAIRIDPKLPNAHRGLGVALMASGDPDGAIAHLKETIQLAPKFPLAHYHLGLALVDRRDLDGAIASWREASELDRKSFPPLTALAWLLATGPDRVRDGKQAVEVATRACELTGWKNPVCIAILAAAHAEAGDFDKAVELQKKALAFPAHEKQY